MNDADREAELERAAQRIAEAAGSEWPQDAGRYRRYARAAFADAARPQVSDEGAAELEAGKDELRSLLDSIWRAEYMKTAPDWKPLDGLPGMVSQIDNMYAGVREQRDQARWDLAALRTQPSQAIPDAQTFLAQVVRIVQEEGPQNPESDWTDYARARAAMRDSIVKRIAALAAPHPIARADGEGRK